MREDERPEKVPTLLLDESSEPQRLLRDPWRVSRAEVIRAAAFGAVLLIFLAVLGVLAWQRLRIRPLLRPAAHRSRPLHSAPSPGPPRGDAP